MKDNKLIKTNTITITKNILDIINTPPNKKLFVQKIKKKFN